VITGEAGGHQTLRAIFVACGVLIGLIGTLVVIGMYRWLGAHTDQSAQTHVSDRGRRRIRIAVSVFGIFAMTFGGFLGAVVPIHHA
jgi:hypothetical protein